MFTSCQKTIPFDEKAPPPKIALALGGGGFKGFAHIGVLKVLEENQIPIDIITGTSAGSVVGSLYASGMSIDELENQAKKFSPLKIIDLSLSGNGGYIKGEKIQRLINQAVHFKSIEEFPYSFAAVATEKSTDHAVIFKQGNPGLVVRASSSIPFIFQPTLIDGKYYIDGGLSSPVPVRAAKELGADIVIAIDISAGAQGQDNQVNTINDIEQTLEMVDQKALNKELQQADIIIRPKLENISVISGILNIEEAIKAGENATKKMLPTIKLLLKQKNLNSLGDKND